MAVQPLVLDKSHANKLPRSDTMARFSIKKN